MKWLNDLFCQNFGNIVLWSIYITCSVIAFIFTYDLSALACYISAICAISVMNYKYPRLTACYISKFGLFNPSQNNVLCCACLMLQSNTLTSIQIHTLSYIQKEYKFIYLQFFIYVVFVLF